MMSLAVFLLGSANGAPMAAAELRKAETWWPTCASFRLAYPDSKEPCVEPESFFLQSKQFAAWEHRYPIGAIIGFALWALAFVITVIMIFYDINKRRIEYDAMIEDDIQTLKNLNLSAGQWEEINKELETRLKGVETEEKGDDQLLGEAAKLNEGEYRQHMQKA